MKLKSVACPMLAFAVAFSAGARIEAASPRETPTVKLIRKIQPAVLPIFANVSEGRISSGTATLIHPFGFLLSNDHIMQGTSGVAIVDGKRVPYRVIGRLPGKDIALLQLKADRLMPLVPIGRSDDIMTGEPIFVAGNPGGRGIVFSQGIVSSPGIPMNVVNVLVMTYFQSGRDEFIQFDAASNRGNSGGPLINAEGRQIGIVSGKNYEEENVNFAIPMDRVRSLFYHLLPVEELSDLWTGIEIDTMAAEAIVKSVASDSPAAKVGVKPGDIISSLDGNTVRHGVDWIISLYNQKADKTISLALKGNDKKHRKIELTPTRYPLTPFVAEKGKKPGLNYQLYHGKFKVLPDFKKLKAVTRGHADDLKTTELSNDGQDFFALTFDGYLKFPTDGVYRLTLGSDDGSKLYLDGKELINNDDNHPMQRLSRIVRVKAGLHPLRVEFFDYTGDAELELEIDGPKLEKKLVPAGWYFRD